MTGPSEEAPRRLRVSVPATAAGLGPGNGCLGVALDIADAVEVEIDRDGSGVSGPEALCQAYRSWDAASLPGVRFTLTREIPEAMGLGEHVALTVAGLTAAAAAVGEKEARQRIMALAVRLGHDAGRVAAAVQGGLVTAFHDGEGLRAAHVANHLLLDVVLYLPNEAELGVERAADAPRLAYLLSALMWGRWDRIGDAMRDPSLAEPLLDIAEAARESGAYGAALSGAGPALIALTPYKEGQGVGEAMAARGKELGLQGSVRVTGVREAGVHVDPVKEE